MDKNTIFGLLLIFLIFIGFSYLNKPSQAQLEAKKRYNDSIALVQQQQQVEELAQALVAESNKEALEPTILPDSLVKQQLSDKYGGFGVAAQGEESFVTLQNELLEVQLSTHGGTVHAARLKKYTDYQGDTLCLFEGEESNFELTLRTATNRVFTTKDFYFQVLSSSDSTAVLRLNAGEDQYMDFVYTLQPDDYMLGFTIVSHNLGNELSPTMRDINIFWTQKIRQQEKGRKFEERYARLTYKVSDDVEQLRETKDDRKDVTTKLKWIGYKDQFFSSVLIAGGNFESAKLDSRYLTNNEVYMKEYTTSTTVLYDPNNSIDLNFYFGPNDYQLLKQYDKTKFVGQNLELEKLVPMGWSLFRTINKYVIRPIFGWLTSFPISLGLAIFLLTLIIKMALFPLIYKSLMSSAKMRVLKPQIEVITAKYPGQENAVTRQQKTMELYKQVGVNPMAGCLPLLLQMPFFIALFWFFPTAIDLRQQSFLWANDLSTYDSLIHWNANIPIISKYLGNHISLFCLLMSLVTLVNSKFTMDQQNTGQEQMPGMKLMMYFMPIMMFFILNSYPAGLNYYYLISTLISVVQTYAFRFFLDEKALLAKLEENKKKIKPAKKKSGFMARLEEAQRQQQALLKERQKQQNKRK